MSRNLSLEIENNGTSKYFEGDKWANFDNIIGASRFIGIIFLKTLFLIKFSD